MTITDLAAENEHSPEISAMVDRMELGGHNPDTFEEADLIILSPGVPHTIPEVVRAREKGVAVWGEIELASRFIREPIVAITGTNGKTTTTQLVGKMLEASGGKVFVGGNIGNPLIAYADGDEKADVLVIEVSSFQLDTIDRFRPRAAILLNITEDHLDRYPGFDAYAKSKARIFENQQADDFAILNSANPLVCSHTQNIKSQKLDIGKGMLQEDGKFQISDSDFHISDIILPPAFCHQPHNLENVSAACLAALALGGTPEGIQSALDHFEMPRHRLEYVAKIREVMYFDDSKATNPDAVVKALECFDKSVILIMGGRGKDNDLSVLKAQVRQKVKTLITIGETKDEIISVLGCECKGTARTASTMKDAVSQAYRAATPGDVVLLSPACASFDMYNSYAERGDVFCQSVERLR